MKFSIWIIWAFSLVVSLSTKLTQVEAKFDELKRVLLELRHELENRGQTLSTGYGFCGSALLADIPIDDEKRTWGWFKEVNEKLRQINNAEATAEWNFQTNINKETSAKKVEVFLQGSRINKDIVNKASLKIKSSRGLGKDTKRALRLLATFADPKNQTDLEQLEKTKSKMEDIYGTATLTKDGHVYNMEPELTKLMENFRDPDVLEWAWKGWRDVTGKKMKSDYAKFVRLANKGAKDNGYTDYGDYWRQEQFDNTPELLDMGAKLWDGIFPLYKKLHAYVRMKLREYYKKHFTDYVFPDDGTIPAHLLGNMWGQEWQNIYDLVKPYPQTTDESVTQAMKFQKYDVNKLFRTAEEFYTSLGLEPMTDTFWNKSMLERPDDRKVQCHASATDFFTDEKDEHKDDFRIKMCTEINSNYFETIHHEMGHIQYFMEYRHQPAIFREGANSAFHEAIGDTISLSVQTRKHLQAIALMPLENGFDADVQKKEMNQLMKHALYKIAFLPFGYLVDLWRYKVFDGTIREDDYNEQWWKLRLQYQGLSAPVTRSRDDFDPGAKFHIPVNSPYFCYFISFIVQFQFYESLCKASGHTGHLHKCDYYQSKEAGEKLRSFLKLGKSKPWRDALEVLTGNVHISTTAIMKYFRPLEEWLDDKIRGEKLGWDDAVINFQ